MVFKDFDGNPINVAEQKDVFYSAFEDEILEDIKKDCMKFMTSGFFEKDKDAKC